MASVATPQSNTEEASRSTPAPEPTPPPSPRVVPTSIFSPPLTPTPLFPSLPSVALSSSDEDRIGWVRLLRYYEYCDAYRVPPQRGVALAFRYPAVQHLVLEPEFTAADLCPLVDMLAYDNIIRSVDAHKAKALGNAACYAFARCFANNSTILEANFNFQDIGEHGAIALSVGLEKSKSLQRVYLRGNRIGVMGAIALARVVRKTRSIVYLDVSNNHLRVRGVHELTRALILRAQARMSAQWASERQEEVNAQWMQTLTAAMRTGDTDAQAANLQHLPLPLPLPPTAMPPDRPKPISGILAGGGLGWLWGNASDLVVTSNYVVRTNFSTHFRFAQAEKSTDERGEGREGVNSLPSPTFHTGRHSRSRRSSSSTAAAAADNAQEGNTGGTRDRSNSGRSAGANSSSEEMEPTIDIEVRISGNFVQEEVFSSVVYGLGLVLSLFGAFPLLSRASSTGDSNLMLGYVAYLAGLIAFFASSTLNHSLFLTDASKVFRLVDHSTVFVLIAGTYTPYLLNNTYHMQPLSGCLLAGVWILAAVGVGLSTLLGSEHETSMQNMRVLLYACMGYLGVVPFFLLHGCIDVNGWWLLAGGGLVFSFGILLYLRRQPHELHSWWYVFVLLACFLHWMAVYYYVSAPTPQCIASDAAYNLGLVWNKNSCENETCAATSALPSLPALLPTLPGMAPDATVAQALVSAASSLGSAAATGTAAMKEKTALLLREILAALEK